MSQGNDSNAQLDARIAVTRIASSTLNSAMEVLFTVFPDHQPSLISESEEQWIFELRFVSDSRTFVDPEVTRAARNIFGLSLAEIGSYREERLWGERDVVVSMVHSWALLAPSRAAARCGKTPLTIVHIDDHTDLMNLLAAPPWQSGLLRDHVFSKYVDLKNPASVVSAVKRGAVNKGNFLTAYLLAYPECRVVHVGCNLLERDFRLRPQAQLVELGGRRLEQYGFTFDEAETINDWRFRQTQSLPAFLPIGANGVVWLDIDLDYFCNRFNGDSDRSHATGNRNERDAVMLLVEDFLNRLGKATWLPAVVAVSIAISPGFFPAEYWGEVTTKIRDGIYIILSR